MVSKFRKKAPKNDTLPLARDNFPRLISNLTSNAINKFERKIGGEGAAKQEKDLLYLFRMKI